MNAMICRVVSQTEKVSITTKEGNPMSKCNIRLKAIGGLYSDEFWCSELCQQADIEFNSGELVDVVMKHTIHENNGNIFNDVTVSEIVKV